MLDGFIFDPWADDRGLWELTWAAAGRTGQSASTFVSWARDCVADLLATERVRLTVSSWPGMRSVRNLAPDDWERLEAEAEPWHDPERASLLVLIQPLGEPPDGSAIEVAEAESHTEGRRLGRRSGRTQTRTVDLCRVKAAL